MPRKVTTQEFINRAQEVWGDQYLYDKSIYVGNQKPIIITCRLHGDFICRPGNFLHKHGCPKCGRINTIEKQKLTKDEFIQKANQIHNNYYDYSKVDYINNKTLVTIICPKHGEFRQLPNSHLQGSGCELCGKNKATSKKSLGIKEFVERAREVHGDKYDYSKVEYVNSRIKVCISCVQHGDFYQTPNNHLRGQGCPKCREYKGEAQISKFLKAHNIEFQTQYPIEYEGNIKGFTYIDFYLPQHNIFIEYNGMQHYIPVEHFGGELKFQQQKKRDQYVRNYCIENNIQLLEIKYGTNIEDELGKYLGT